MLNDLFDDTRKKWWIRVDYLDRQYLSGVSIYQILFGERFFKLKHSNCRISHCGSSNIKTKMGNPQTLSKHWNLMRHIQCGSPKQSAAIICDHFVDHHRRRSHETKVVQQKWLLKSRTMKVMRRLNVSEPLKNCRFVDRVTQLQGRFCFDLLIQSHQSSPVLIFKKTIFNLLKSEILI